MIQVELMAKPSIDKIIDYVILIIIIEFILITSFMRQTRLCGDFVAFYIAGKLGVEGRISEAYHTATMFREIASFCSAPLNLPWTYPPPFSLFAELLYVPSYAVSYCIFMFVTITIYFTALKRLSASARDYNIARAACMPAIIGNIIVGQNGFLTGALVGFFALLYVDRKKSAGIPLGMLAIKPHLAVGIGFLPLVRKDWRTFISAGLVAGLMCLFATAAFGLDVWSYFAASVGEAADFLKTGRYPFTQMTSVYASAYTVIPIPTVAASLQAMCAMISLAAIYYCSRLYSVREALGAAILLSLGISPYIYFYDWAIYGVSLALLLPCILQYTTFVERVLFFSLSVVASGDPFVKSTKILPLGAVCFLLLAGIILLALHRKRVQTAQLAVGPEGLLHPS